MVGRPKLPIDAKLVENLARYGMKTREIADALNCSHDTLQRHFASEMTKGRTELKLSLRRTQIATAEMGNATMQIWLGKQILGQSDTSLDDYIEDAIDKAGLTKEDLLELIANKDAAFRGKPKRSFHEFCALAGYPTPFDKQVEMMKFAFDGIEPGLLLGSRGYGKTDYVTIAGTAYSIYLDPVNSTNLIITKSRDRNAALLGEIAEMCRKNGMVFDIENTTRLRLVGMEGKEDNASAITINAKSLRGRHPFRVIMDDPVTEDDVSESTRTRARRVLNEVMKLTKNVVLIGQPAHQYDLYADVRGKIRTLEVPFGAIPELDHDLEAQRLAGVSEASISASYFLKVISEGTTPFDKANILEDPFPTTGAVAFIDPSEGGDYTAVSIVSNLRMQTLAVVGFVYKRAWNTCIEDMTAKFARYNVKRVAFETNCTGEMPIELLRKAWPGIGVVGVRANTNKHSRIMAAGSYAHLIHLSKESDRLYLDHVMKYEYKSKYDDAPDSLASCLSWVGLIRGKE